MPALTGLNGSCRAGSFAVSLKQKALTEAKGRRQCIALSLGSQGRVGAGDCTASGVSKRLEESSNSNRGQTEIKEPGGEASALRACVLVAFLHPQHKGIRASAMNALHSRAPRCKPSPAVRPMRLECRGAPPGMTQTNSALGAQPNSAKGKRDREGTTLTWQWLNRCLAPPQAPFRL